MDNLVNDTINDENKKIFILCCPINVEILKDKLNGKIIPIDIIQSAKNLHKISFHDLSNFNYLIVDGVVNADNINTLKPGIMKAISSGDTFYSNGKTFTPNKKLIIAYSGTQESFFPSDLGLRQRCKFISC